MKMESGIGFHALSFALLFAATALPAQAASFSAELVDTRAGQTHTGPFYVQDTNYRFEMIQRGQTVIITGDGSSGVVRLLVPSEKLYLETGPNEPMSRMMSPFAFFAHYARTHEVRAEGTENIDGVACTKKVAFAGEQVFATAWFSEKYDFPLKVDVPIDSRVVEVRNIKPGAQDAALFAVPADYKPAPKAGEPPPPDWAAQVPGAPVMTPPFEQTLTAGQIIRIRPQAGRHIRIQGTNPAQETCAFTSVGFKDGRPCENPSYGTVNLDADQDVSVTHTKTPAEADDIVVRVRNGRVKIKAEFVAASGDSESVSEPAPASPASTEEARAEIMAPIEVNMGSRFELSWIGPANDGDFISIARPDQPPGAHVSMTRVREGDPLKIWAPSDPGLYELRYVVARGSKLLTSSPLVVNAVTASVEAAGPVKAGGWIDATWEGPAGDGDSITVASVDQPPGAQLARTAVRHGNPTRVRAPGSPGEFEVRYIFGRGSKLLGKTTIVVEDVTATVVAPATAKVATDFEVTWTGPGYQEDSIVIARQDQPPGANVGYKATRTGNPVKIRAPKEPGTYEVRYVFGHGRRSLATTTITIEAP